jgi:hypothetical protein
MRGLAASDRLFLMLAGTLSKRVLDAVVAGDCRVSQGNCSFARGLAAMARLDKSETEKFAAWTVAVAVRRAAVTAPNRSVCVVFIIKCLLLLFAISGDVLPFSL